MSEKHPQVQAFHAWKTDGFSGDARLRSQMDETLYLAFSAGVQHGFDTAKAIADLTPKPVRTWGLVNELEREIERLNADIRGWQHDFNMYRTAWLREIGGVIKRKAHEIDGFVLRTRELVAEALEKERQQS